MKKIIFAFILLSFGYVAANNPISKVYSEYLRRDQWKATPEQGAVMNFLNAVKYPVTHMIGLDILTPSTSYALKDKNGLICVGDMVQQIMTCKNELGISGGFSLENGTAVMDFASLQDSPSIIYQEFNRRNQLKLPLLEELAVRFIKSLKYDAADIVEMEMLTPSTSFVFRDRNGDYCYGDVQTSLMRCKNELGVTSTSFNGDTE